MASWHLLGEVVVSNDWQLLPNPTINNSTFRITTTIFNQADWNTWKFRSGAYIQFFYPSSLGGYSQPRYIRVENQPIIYEFLIPQPFLDNGVVTRDLLVKRASKYLPITPNDMFASWSIKVEEYY